MNTPHKLYREYRIREVTDEENKIHFHIEYYYSPFPITDEFKIPIKMWVSFFKTASQLLAIDLCNTYQTIANRHLNK